MAKKAYIGVNGVARNVKKMYVGVEKYIANDVGDTAGTLSSFGLAETDQLQASTAVWTIDQTTGEWITTGTIKYVTVATVDGNIPSYRAATLVPVDSPKDAYGIRPDYAIQKTTISKAPLARRIKKAYIGVGGVARPCFGHDPIEYYGTVTPLSFARSGPSGVSLGDYGLLGGGSYYVTNKRTYSNVVDVYNKSLTRTTATNLSLPRISGTAISNGNYALFAVGQAATSTGLVSNVDAYNKNLTRTTPSALANGGTNIGSTTIGGYMIIGGRPSGTTYTAQLTTYSSTLARTTNISLSVARAEISGAHVGAYGLLAGGLAKGYVGSSVVDAYTANLVRSTPTAFSLARSASQGASISAYAIFAGGWSKEDDHTSVVDAYSSSLTRTTATSLSQPVGVSGPGASFPTHALFRVGNWSSAMNVYDSKLIRSIAHNRSN